MNENRKEDSKAKYMRQIANQIVLLTQLGLSFIMPLLLCVFLCWYLTGKFSLGGWIYIPGFFFGLGGSFMTAYKFYLAEVQKQDKKDKKKTVSFNKHS